jgi:hypothetical protein
VNEVYENIPVVETAVQRALRAQAELNETRQAAIDGILAQVEQLKAQLVELGHKRPRKKAEPAKKRGRPPKVQAPATE